MNRFSRLLAASRAMRRPRFRSNHYNYAVAAGFLLIGASTLRPEDQDSVDSLCYFAKIGNLHQIKKLADQRKENDIFSQRHTAGWTALHAAAANNQNAVVTYLLEHGADVNARDEYPTKRMFGEPSPDQQSLRRGFHDDVNPTYECQGWTPLHYAAVFGHIEVAETLIKNGADPKIRSARGETPMDIAHYRTDKGSEKYKRFLRLFEEAERFRLEYERKQRLLYPLEEKLQKVMIGQSYPIHAISGAIRRRDNGWEDDKPLVFLFLGSSGVGKTMLAKQIAQELVKDKEKGFVRLDMSEYQSKHELSRLIGSPPGYIGHEQGGQLTKALEACPDAVVLLDEVEKAHPDVLTLMLQVFDEGRLTDGQGKTVQCKRALFIMTSNLVQDEIRNAPKNGYRIRPHKPDLSDMDVVREQTNDFIRKIVHPILKRHFKRDEFLGRINEMVIFHPFSQDDLRNIVTLELKSWQKRAKQKHDIDITWSDELVDVLKQGYDERYGFRSIKYEVEKRVVNKLAAAHEKNEIRPGCSLNIELDSEGHIQLTNIKAKEEEEKSKGKWFWER